MASVSFSDFNSTLEQAGNSLIPQPVKPLIDGETFTIVALSLLVSGLVISLLGVFANVINIRTFIKLGVEDGVTTLFLAISCSDFIYVIAASIRNISAVILTLEKHKQYWLIAVEPRVSGVFSDTFTYMMYATTTLLSTFMSVARCMCVAKPLHFKNMFTRRRCLIGCVICFLFPASCETAVLLNMGTTRQFNAETNSSRIGLWLSSDRERVKDLMRFMTNFIVPLVAQVIAVVCVSIMITKLRQAAHFRANMNTDQQDSGTKLTGKDRMVVKQVVVILLIFIVINLQRIAESFLELYDPRIEQKGAYNNLMFIMDNFGIACQSFNATVNILVYYSYHSKFRSVCFAWKGEGK